MSKSKIQFVSILLEKLVMAEYNYKKFDDELMMKKLVSNIKKNGQVENIIVRDIGKGSFELVNGNHRFLAMKELGIKEAMCCNLGKISETKAKRISIETNETGFKADSDKLSILLNEIVLSEEDFFETNPFTEIEMSVFNNISMDDEEPILTQSTKKKQKSKTVTSMAGETYTTLKIEATPEQAELFTLLIQRLKGANGSEGESLSVICSFMSKYTDKEVLASTTKKETKKKAK